MYLLEHDSEGQTKVILSLVAESGSQIIGMDRADGDSLRDVDVQTAAERVGELRFAVGKRRYCVEVVNRRAYSGACNAEKSFCEGCHAPATRLYLRPGEKIVERCACIRDAYLRIDCVGCETFVVAADVTGDAEIAFDVSAELSMKAVQIFAAAEVAAARPDVRAQVRVAAEDLDFWIVPILRKGRRCTARKK